MAINIQNLLDAIAAKSASNTPGTLSAGESDALVNLVTETSNLYDTFYQSDSATGFTSSQEGLVKTLYSLNTDSFYFTSGRGDWRKQTFLTSTVVDQSPKFQGRTVGLVGTFTHTPSPSSTSAFRRIQKFSLASNANATETNNLYAPSPTNPSAAPVASRNKAGFPNHVSHAYMSGGPNFPSPNPATPGTYFSALIDKFPFAITTELAVNAGDLPQDGEDQAAVSSAINGYIAGGRTPPWPGFTQTNQIRQFIFSSEGTATNIGTLNTAVRNHTGHCDETHGYIAGGSNTPGPQVTTIERFPFVTPVVSTSNGSLSVATQEHGGISSFTDGYTIGGSPGAALNMEKFPFSSTTPGSVIASLSLITATAPTATFYYDLAGISGYDYGYYAGGQVPGLPNQGALASISRFPYSSESTQSDIGDLVRNATEAASNQG